MNTVKRWLAGLLSFAMIFTSAGLSSVGTVVTFAAKNAIVVTNDDGTKNYASGKFDEALDETVNYPYYSRNKKLNTKITLNEDATTAGYQLVYMPLVIDLNGHKLNGWDTLVDNNQNGWSAEFDDKGYPTTITFFEDDGRFRVYNWVYDAKGTHDPMWYVKSITIFNEAGIAIDDPIDAESIGRTRYYPDANMYVYRGKYNDRKLMSRRPADDIDVNGWLLSGGPFIVNVNGENQHEGNKPVVRAFITKINTGEPLAVSPELVAATDDEINEAMIQERIGKDEGNKAATCESDGVKVWKAIVKDPEGKVVTTAYVVDKQAADQLDHVQGVVRGYEVKVASGYEYASKQAAIDAAKRNLVEQVGDEEVSKFETNFIDVEAGEVEVQNETKQMWRYIYWDYQNTNVFKDDKSQDTDLTGVVKVPANVIIDEETGSFNYRMIYNCAIAKTDNHVYYGKEEKTAKPYGDASTAQDFVGRKKSSCTYWVYEPIVEKYDNGTGKLDRTFTGNIEFVGTSEYDYEVYGSKYEGLAYPEGHDVNDPALYQEGHGHWEETPGMYPWSAPIRTWVPNILYPAVVMKNIHLRAKELHKPVGTSTVVVVPATCLEPGTTTFECTLCSKNADDQKPGVDPIKDHVFRSYTGEGDVYGNVISKDPEDRRKGAFNYNKTELTFEKDCTHDGGTYLWCDGTNNKDAAGNPLGGHWVLKEGTLDKATGHSFKAGKVDWKAYKLNDDGTDWEEIKNTTQAEKDVNKAFEYVEGHDYVLIADSRKCERKDCNFQTDDDIKFHYIDGENTATDIYNAIDVSFEEGGKDCQSYAKTTYTVKKELLTYDNGSEVSTSYSNPDVKGNHVLSVDGWNWSKDYEFATIYGHCTVKGCNDPDGHPGTDAATVTKKTDGDTGITTFTGTYKDKTDVQKGYTLKGAKITFDASKIEDPNLLPGIAAYASAVEGPEVKVEMTNSDGTVSVINPDLYNVTWEYEYPEGIVTSTARELYAKVRWNKDALDSSIKVVGRSWENGDNPAYVTAKEVFDWDVYGADEYIYDPDEVRGIEVVPYKYNPKSGKTKALKDAIVKYYVSNEDVCTSDDPAENQAIMEGLEYTLDEVAVKDVGEYYVYAQITKEGYTTATFCAGTFTIIKKDVAAYVDNVTVVEGTVPVFKLRAYEVGSLDQEVVINPDELSYATLGGADLTSLTPGEYKILVTSKNYDIHYPKNNDYVCVLTVISMDDSTEVDQAKAKAVEDQILALSDNPTEAEVAAARAAYDKLPDSAKARISADALKKLTDAEEAIQAVKDADAAIAAAKGYETDAAVKAALDALTEALNKRDTAAIKTATTNLTNAINQAKDAKAAVDAANAAIAAANAYASDANIKALIDALNAAIAKGDTAAIKAATTKLNDAVAAKKAAPAPVVKKAPKITFKTKSPKKIKASKLKKKAQTFKIKASADSKGTITYKKAKGSSKKVKISKKGKVTVKKGTKKGTYKLKVKATAAAKGNFKSGSKTKTYKIVVK